MVKPTISEILADFTAKIDYYRIPHHIRERAKMRVLDFLGVALAGSQIPSSRIVIDVVKELGGKKESTVIGEGIKVSCTNAALANGTMAHASDYDDDHRSATMHPGSVVVPTALALGEREGCEGTRLIEAIVAGYEVVCRVGEAFLGTQYHEGFHPTGTCGVFGAAAAASKILRLLPKEIVWAFGIAGTQASGLEEWKTDGTWTKRMHPGKAAQNGILAVLLAKKGFTGPRTIFEGKYGFLNAYSYERTYDAKKIIEGLGEVFVSHQTAFKPYPCCRFLHQVIDGVLEMVNHNKLAPEDIKEVKIKTFKVGIDTLIKPEDRRYRPKTIVDAQFSIPFVVGAAVVRKRVSLAEFTEESIRDPEILEIASRVKGEEDPKYTQGYPERFPTSIKIELKNGNHLECYVDIPSGDPEKKDYIEDPLKFNKEIVEKFFLIVSKIPSFSHQGHKIVAAVQGLEEVKDISKLMRLLASEKEKG
jgi:2-methylcitrate dehydratase PrpD